MLKDFWSTTYQSLIDILSNSIEEWEISARKFSEFNREIKQIDSGVAILRTLMQQYGLKTSDFKNEIGGKSMISMVLNGSRMLSRPHIQALSTRFHISPAIFFEHV